jgi:hypothetical protein
MDYSLLVAVHNITEEVKSTQKLNILPPSLLPSPATTERTPSSDTFTNTSTSTTHEEIRTTLSIDSGIAMTHVSNLPTYIQYIRVIEFIRAQQAPSIRSSSVSNAENFLSDNQPSENPETASIRTVKADLSSTAISDNQSTVQRNSKSPINPNDISSSYPVTHALMGGEVWYNRQNLSRLAMYVIDFFILIGLSE